MNRAVVASSSLGRPASSCTLQRYSMYSPTFSSDSSGLRPSAEAAAGAAGSGLAERPPGTVLRFSSSAAR